MSVSSRGQGIPVSAMRKYIPFANAARKRGVDVIPLNLGQPDIETPPQFWDAVKRFGDKEPALGYAPSGGRPELVDALVKYYGRFDIPLKPSELVVSVGGCEAILMSVMAVTDPGDHILVFEPFYSNYSGVFAMCSVKADVATCSIENGYHLPSADVIEKAIVPGKTKAIMYASPGNPTGTTYTEEEIRMLGALAVKHKLFLIGDEVYREFSYSGKIPFSVLQLGPETQQYAILVDSVSKRYSACGARIGCVASRNADLMASILKLATVRLSAPALDQVAIAATIDDGVDEYIRNVNKEYTLRRDVLLEGLRAIPGVTCPTPTGAFYAVAKLDGIDTDAFCKWLLEDFTHDGKTVLLAPGGGFYQTPGLGADEVRIAYVLKVERIKEATSVLAEAVKQWRAKHPVKA
eukprot:TRINITY_DN23424_c0_g1_i1.p1 TRINITY_DN23424_c0_g1~~TRINITY_DN23424_c0_g1_i1.p1  ORF type:complete len:451 (-),score=91.26 TRINITY_DN23424_c0_g1_i1:214-1434(-)